MLCFRVLINAGASANSVLLKALVAHMRREVFDAAGIMAEVVLRNFGSTPLSCLLKGSKAFDQKVRSVLAGLE